MIGDATEELLARLDALEAQDAVRKLKAAYMQGLDDRLRGRVADLFWEDAVWESLPGRAPTSPPPSAPIVGREAIAQSFVDAANWMSFTAHYLTNEDIAVTGDRAVGRWKLLQTCTAEATDTAFWQAGVYVDDFERRDGVWKFSRLRLAMDFRTPFDEGWAKTRFWDPTKDGS
ncbi:nuclear transport factor 2 family protein [Cryptosporangium phraense]|uniref:Nuclear transport factor 2 family protein n=1 Tax=Cryptosporangium phraense TaxID=2593070 RepID=A0A545APD2_9ACTN|nr:nuclear transport factor 2 family protein [Cryptosporangium phraense]TQS43177.1 nuclear transport factor 2 family protein [Cryptosporangium phraense]